MKNFSSTIVFAAVVVIVGGLVYWDNQSQIEKDQVTTKQQLILPDWSVNQVNELKISGNESQVHLKKESGKWKILSPVKDDADGSSVEDMLRTMLSEQVQKVSIEGSINLAKYGFDTAKRMIELVHANAEKKSVQVSTKKTFDGQYYVRVLGTENLVLASGSWDSWVTRKTSEIRNKKVLPDGLNVVGFSFQGPEKYEVLKDDEKWKLIGDENFNIDKSKLEGKLTAIKNFRANDVVAEEINSQTLKKYNLRKPAMSFELTLADSTDKLIAYVSKETKNSEDVFLYTSKKPFIYKTSKPSIRSWKISKNDFEMEPPKKESEPKENTDQPKSTK